MNIDRYMANLFFEIRRNLPKNQQRQMKISSPTLGDDIIFVYKNSDDESIRLLIEVFLERAGEKWLKKLHSFKAH